MPCCIRSSASGGWAARVKAAQASKSTRIHPIYSRLECDNIVPIIMRVPALCVSPLIALLVLPSFADDWPEWRGAGRRGEYRESGVLDTFPASGLKVKWRTPIHAG